MPASVIPVKGLYLGFVGSISNEGYSLRSARQVRPADTLSIHFGETVVLNTDNTYSSLAEFILLGGTYTDAAGPLGIAVSNVNINPAYSIQGTNGVNTPGGVYPPASIADCLVQGTINVYCANGTPTAGGPVYVRVSLNGAIPNGVVGGLEATTDTTHTVLCANLKWKTGFLEVDGTAQVTILERKIP